MLHRRPVETVPLKSSELVQLTAQVSIKFDDYAAICRMTLCLFTFVLFRFSGLAALALSLCTVYHLGSPEY